MFNYLPFLKFYKAKQMFINRKCLQFKTVETVEQEKDLVEIKRLLTEYQMSDPSGNYYLSKRCTKDWK